MNLIDIGIFSNLFFNGHVLFQSPFEFYITYLPIILLLPVFILRYGFPREIYFILIPLILTGIINVLINNNTFGNFFKIFANITVNLIFYRYVMEHYKFDLKKMFGIYMNGCFIVALLGLIQLISNKVGFTPGYNWNSIIHMNKWGVHPGGLGIRINSTFSEPSGFALSLAPGCFMSIYGLLRKNTDFVSKQRAIVILSVYILSFSSLAFLGVFLSILLITINFGLVRYVFIAIPLALILFRVAYNNAEEFKKRIDGMQALFIDDILNTKTTENEPYALKVKRIRFILSKVHGSSFVLYNNYHIANENFKNNPLFGSGLGSHEIAFEKYNLNYILGDIYRFNTSDANSMFLRILSETGLMGVIFVFFFIFKFYVSKNLAGEEDETYWLISNALLVIILIQLLRQGNYTYSGFMFYAWLYYFTKIKYNEYKQNEGVTSKEGKNTLEPVV